MIQVMESLMRLLGKKTLILETSGVASAMEVEVLDSSVSHCDNNYDCMWVSYGDQSFAVDYNDSDPEQFRSDVEFAENYLLGDTQVKKK